MNISCSIGWGSGGPRRQPLMSPPPGKHSLDTTQEAGR